MAALRHKQVSKLMEYATANGIARTSWRRQTFPCKGHNFASKIRVKRRDPIPLQTMESDADPTVGSTDGWLNRSVHQFHIPNASAVTTTSFHKKPI
ncbi:unnamed protein product [Cyprideis torosa]|uniref:Uncharacterized protein n=1 Tax=Cyprideis torosa TaxID=163714 RepID=A0A7R8W1C0_9CRUS|nr:unnamed protein product [Cyprideis torosa]CAG0880741.1 unnamed protein product [Cyprideis torosa]